MKNLSTLLLFVLTVSINSNSQTFSIYELQYTASISGESPQLGNVVTTYGIVTGVFTIGDEGNFFIQDGSEAWSGIYVNDNTYQVAIGDSVELTGTVTEDYGMTEIVNLSNLTIISSGNPAPTPILIPTSDLSQEKYEAVVVHVTNATCANANAGFGQFIVNDGSGNSLIDDEIYHFTPTLNNVYDIIGVRYFLFGESKICPRNASDIITQFTVGIEEQVLFSIYPNPATDLVTINVQPTTTIQIYNMVGSLVFSGSGKMNVDLSEFEAGVYFVAIRQNQTTRTQKLVIR